MLLVFLTYSFLSTTSNAISFHLYFYSKDGSLENGTNWQTLLWNSAKQRPEAQNWTSKLLSMLRNPLQSMFFFFLRESSQKQAKGRGHDIFMFPTNAGYRVSGYFNRWRPRLHSRILRGTPCHPIQEKML